jgi:hypothetical protein
MSKRNAAALHRRFDTSFAESLARDGRELVEHCGALILPWPRRNDMRTITGPREPRVLLMPLAERASGQGRRYFSGWLGKAKLVGFKGEPDEHGKERWDVYAAEPEQRQGDTRREAQDG